MTIAPRKPRARRKRLTRDQAVWVWANRDKEKRRAMARVCATSMTPILAVLGGWAWNDVTGLPPTPRPLYGRARRSTKPKTCEATATHDETIRAPDGRLWLGDPCKREVALNHDLSLETVCRFTGLTREEAQALRDGQLVIDKEGYVSPLPCDPLDKVPSAEAWRQVPAALRRKVLACIAGIDPANFTLNPDHGAAEGLRKLDPTFRYNGRVEGVDMSAGMPPGTRAS